MTDSTATPEQQLVENEVVFREFNEGVQKGFNRLKKIAKEDSQEYLVHDTSNIPIHYLCECADENCQKRIVIKPSVYDRIHKNRKRFIVSIDHDVPSIEKIVHKEPNYFVVEKHKIVHTEHATLHKTDIDNS